MIILFLYFLNIFCNLKNPFFQNVGFSVKAVDLSVAEVDWSIARSCPVEGGLLGPG